MGDVGPLRLWIRRQDAVRCRLCFRTRVRCGCIFSRMFIILTTAPGVRGHPCCMLWVNENSVTTPQRRSTFGSPLRHCCGRTSGSARMLPNYTPLSDLHKTQAAAERHPQKSSRSLLRHTLIFLSPCARRKAPCARPSMSDSDQNWSWVKAPAAGIDR